MTMTTLMTIYKCDEIIKHKIKVFQAQSKMTKFISFEITKVDFEKLIILKNKYFFKKFDRLDFALVEGNFKIQEIINDAKRPTMYCASGRSDQEK